MPETRAQRDERLGQYEIPAFRAGHVAALAERALWLVRRHAERYGESVLLSEAARCLEQAVAETAAWIELAQGITGYEYARPVETREERAR